MRARPAERTLAALARLAADAGPAVVPAPVGELLDCTVSTGQQLFAAAACSIALVEGSELVFRAAAGAGAQAVLGVRLPIGRGIAGWVATSGQPIAVREVQRDPRFARDVAESTGYLPQQIVAVPLDSDRELLGVLEVLDPADGRWSLDLVVQFSRQTALAVQAWQAFDDLGRALFGAAAGRVGEEDVAGVLRRLAAASTGPRAELAGLVADLAAVSRLDTAERATAAALLRAFLDHAQAGQR